MAWPIRLLMLDEPRWGPPLFEKNIFQTIQEIQPAGVTICSRTEPIIAAVSTKRLLLETGRA